MFLSGGDRSINGSVYDRKIAETIAGPCKKKIKKAGNKPDRRHIPRQVPKREGSAAPMKIFRTKMLHCPPLLDILTPQGPTRRMNTTTDLKQRILDLLLANEEVSFAQMTGIPGFTGDQDLVAPEFANLVLWRGLSPEAMAALEELEDDEVIRFARTDAKRYALDGFTPTLPVALRVSKYRTPSWLPVLVSLWNMPATKG